MCFFTLIPILSCIVQYMYSLQDTNSWSDSSEHSKLSTVYDDPTEFLAARWKDHVAVDLFTVPDEWSPSRTALERFFELGYYQIDTYRKRMPHFYDLPDGPVGKLYSSALVEFDMFLLAAHYHLFNVSSYMRQIDNLFYLTFDSSPATLSYPWQIFFQSPFSPFMDKLDLLHGYIMGFLIFIVVFVLSWLFFLLLRFSCKSFRGSIRKIVQIQHNSLLEFIWTVVPFAILLIIFSSSAALIYDGANKTNILETIKVIGNQWYWNYGQISSNTTYLNTYRFPVKTQHISFAYINYDSYIVRGWLRICEIPGERDPEVCVYHPFYLLKSDNPLLLPAREWLRFLISSNDVIHSWALPVAGIKCDAVPGRINEVVSLLSLSGEYFGQCSELCGINHGFMPIHVWCYNDSNIF